MSTRCALPPGVYIIQTPTQTPATTVRAVINPAAQGGQLTVDLLNTSNIAQRWLVTGSGRVMPMSAASSGHSQNQHTTIAAPVATTAVTRSATAYEWVINVVANNDRSFTGYIRCSDSPELFWTPTNNTAPTGSNVPIINTVIMGNTPVNWNFMPVP
jgi:hypothetical protein